MVALRDACVPKDRRGASRRKAQLAAAANAGHAARPVASLRRSTPPVPPEMFRRTGPHQFRRRALSAAHARLERAAGRRGAIRPLAVPPFAQAAAALAAPFPHLHRGTQRPSLASRVDCHPLYGGGVQDLVGSAWAWECLWRFVRVSWGGCG